MKKSRKEQKEVNEEIKIMKEKKIIFGRLCKDPEVRHDQNQTQSYNTNEEKKKIIIVLGVDDFRFTCI